MTVLSANGGGGSPFTLILMYVALFGILWFFMIRPQRKRQKEVREMQDNIKVSNWVVTSAGMYGKVVDIVNNICIVEFGTNKSIRIPVERAQIAGIGEPNLSIQREEEPAIEEKKDKE